MSTPLERVDVSHSDGRTVEVVRGLDRRVALRLVEHEQNAGRVATILPPAVRRPRYR